jgi:hypothetical protein
METNSFAARLAKQTMQQNLIVELNREIMIAQYPALVGALRDLLTFVDTSDTVDSGLRIIANQARALLAKAVR